MTQRRKRLKSPAGAMDSPGIIPAKKRSRHDISSGSQPPRKRASRNDAGDLIMRRSSRRDKRSFEIDNIEEDEDMAIRTQNSLVEQSPRRTRGSRRGGDSEPAHAPQAPVQVAAGTNPASSRGRKVIFEMDEIQDDRAPTPAIVQEPPKKHGWRRSSRSAAQISPSATRRRSSDEFIDLTAAPLNSRSVTNAIGSDKSTQNSGRRGKKGKNSSSSSRRKPVFEEDDLENPGKIVTFREDANTGASAASAAEPGRRVFEEDELDSTSDEDAAPDNDIDYMIDLPDDDDEGEEETTNLSPLGDVGGDDYKMFLRSCLGEDGSVLPHPTEDALAALLDDDQDIDFDYLREAAIVPDDPYEYRDDRAVHVSTREVVQLVQHQDTLRMKTRGRKPNRIAGDPAAENTNSAPQTVTLQAQQIAPAPMNMPVPNYNYTNQRHGQQVAQQITAEDIALLKDQYAQHIHLLAVIHADASQILAQGEDDDEDEAGDTNHLLERTVEKAKETLDITTGISKKMLARKETSQAFWNLVAPFRNVHEIAGRGGEQFSHPFHIRDSVPSAAPIISLFDSPALHHMPGFLEACRTADWDRVAPLDVVSEKLGNTAHPHVSRAVLAEVRDGVVVHKSGPRTLRMWSRCDDGLLHMTLHKHSRDFGEKFVDLLPHRTEAECRNRVKYLSSRRVCENPIKRFVMDNSVALSKQEIDVLKTIFKNRQRGTNYGVDATADNYLWKCIQRDFFPNREISMLRKLWELRETRRMYKIKYREKQKRTKGASERAANSDSPTEGPTAPTAAASTAAAARNGYRTRAVPEILPNATHQMLLSNGYHPQPIMVQDLQNAKIARPTPAAPRPAASFAPPIRIAAPLAPAPPRPIMMIAPTPARTNLQVEIAPILRTRSGPGQVARATPRGSNGTEIEIEIGRATSNVQIAPAIAPAPPNGRRSAVNIAPAPVGSRHFARSINIAPAPLYPQARSSGARPIAPSPSQGTPGGVLMLPQTRAHGSSAVHIAPAPSGAVDIRPKPSSAGSNAVHIAPAPFVRQETPSQRNGTSVVIPGPPPMPPPLPPRLQKRPIVTKLQLS